MRIAAAIFRKQWKDTLKNKTVLIQFVMFPLITLIMTNAVQIDGMPKNFFVNLFVTMYIGMAPLVAMAAILSEEKEKNTLRVLLMSNVKPHEYLLGIGSHVFLASMLGCGAICAGGRFTAEERVLFLGVAAVGILTSLLLGAAIGTWSKTQMAASSVSVSVMLVFSFLPMLSMFNATIEKAAKFAYTQQISRMLNEISVLRARSESICILTASCILSGVLFFAAYRKRGLA